MGEFKRRCILLLFFVAERLEWKMKWEKEKMDL